MLRTVYNRNYIYITLLLLLTEYESDFKSQKHFMLDIRKFSSFYLSFKLTIFKMLPNGTYGAVLLKGREK